VLENYQKPQGQLTPPDSPSLTPVHSRPFLLPLTSHSENGGKLLQKAIVGYIERNPHIDARDLVCSYSTRRTLHQFRAYAIGNTVTEISQVAANLGPEAKWKRADVSPRLGLVFTGQGAQWHAMGRQLIEESAFFRQLLSESEEVIKTLPDAPSWSLLDELTKPETDSRLSQSEFSQPLCTALQIALVDILKVWGIKASAVVGHSSGEIAAAYAAGILSRRDAIICAFYRGLYMSRGKNGAPGSMMAVGLTEAEAILELEHYTGRACIAAINSPSSITLSGDQDALIEIKEKLDSRKAFARLLQVEQAFHSHHMLPLAPAFQQALANTEAFSPQPAKIRMFSSVMARDSSARPMDGTYWSENMTGRVRFSDALTGMVLDDNEEPAVDILVEIGPHPALKGPAKQTIKSLGLNLPYVASLDRKIAAFDSLLACAGQLFALGYDVDLEAVNSDHLLSTTGSALRVATGKILDDIPTYSWDHKSYWAETRYGKEYRKRTHRHSLLGAPVPGSPSTNPRWHNYLRKSELAWLSGHSIDSSVILPGAAYFTIAIEALMHTEKMQQIQEIVLSDVKIKAALSIPDSETGVETMLDLSLLEDLSNAQTKSYKFAIYSFTEDGETIYNCSGTISANTSPTTERTSQYTFEEFQSRTLYHHPADKFYERLSRIGLQYGESFRLVHSAFESAHGLAVAPVRYDPGNVIIKESDACVLHPTFVDAAFHVVFAALESKVGRALDDAYVPTFCHTLRISTSMIAQKQNAAIQDYWVTAETNPISPRLISNDVVIHTKDSKVRLVELHGLEMTALGLSGGKDSPRPAFFHIKWQPAFDALGLNAVEPVVSGLDDVLAYYIHQYPENKILHISSESQQVNEASQFDLLVVDAGSYTDIQRLLKPSGHVISTSPQFISEALQSKFAHGNLTIWQLPSHRKWTQRLTILIGSSPSEETLNLVRAIQRVATCEQISISTLSELSQKSIVQNDFVSLVGLDEDILLSASSKYHNQFEALKKILCTPAKRLLWLYKNVEDGATVPSQSLISGLARSARSENESLRLVLLELSQEFAIQHACDWIQHVLSSTTQDDEFTVRDGCLLIPRVEVSERLNSQISGRYDEGADSSLSFKNHRLRLTGSLSDASSDIIAFEHDSNPGPDSLEEDEVEIAVEESALTREDTIDSCVGTVVNIGSNSKLQKGDKVFALSPSSTAHASILRTKAHLVHTLEDTHSAASIGVPLLKAVYALHELARVQKSDLCLVHDGASLMGQIAISLLRSMGAVAIISVRKEADAQILIDHFSLPSSWVVVAASGDSRKLLEEIGNNRKCRVVLNCSTESAGQVLLDCLSTYGHLIEFCKRTTSVTQSNHVTYTSVDLGAVLSKEVHVARKLLEQSFKIWKEVPFLLPSPGLRFPYSHLSDAVESFKQDPNLRQVLLYANDDPVPVRRCRGGLPTLFNPEKTYLLVGGLGGLGKILAQWMFRKGARKFSFLARSGATQPKARETVKWLERRGARVTVHSGNVTDEATVHEWVKTTEGDIGGVFQGATVLHSGSLSDMTASTWQTVLDPKVKGSMNLHYATAGRSLDFFLCFSSILAIIGFPSEANYSAANSFMDNFIAWRRKNGLPGASMNIGVVADAGLVAESESMKAGMQRVGMDMLSEEELFFQFEHAILSQYPDGNSNGIADHQILSGINVASKDPFWSAKPLFWGLYANVAAGAGAGSETRKDLRSLLRAAENLEKMKAILSEAFVEKIASSLSIPSAHIHIGLPLSSYGMDSLVAVDFRKWFSKDVGVDLALFDILGSKTTALLIQRVCEIFATQEDGKPEPSLPSRSKAEKQDLTQENPSILVSYARPDHIPLSSFQKRLWFMDNVMEEDGGLSIGMTLMLRGKPKLDHVNSSFHELARRNESLRTRYFEGDGFAEQEILATMATNVEFLDLSNELTPFDRVQSEVKDLTKRPMDLEKGEVYRSRLVKLSNSDYAWLFSIHHIAIDGGSRESFMEQIVSCYNDVSTGSGFSNSAPELSYVDFTLWHGGILQSPEIQSTLDWWKQHLNGASPTSKLLPFAQHNRSDKASDDRRTIRTKIVKSTLKRMKRICSGVNVTPFHFILAALRSFIYRYTSEEDFTMLIINGERPHPAFEGMIGFFVNVIPLRWKGTFEDTFEDQLLQAKALAMETMAHSQAPFDSIVDTLEMGWNPKHFPLGQIALNYQMYAKSPKYTTTDFEISDVHVTDVPTACELQFEVMEDPETGLGFTLDYDSYLYSASDMDRFLENFMTFIESAVQDFRQPIEEIELCGPKELDVLQTTHWLGETSILPWMEQPLWERFVEVTHQQPRSIAVKTSDRQSITYKALKKKAEETASLLQSLGVHQGHRVGVLSHPSIEAIAAMLSMALLRCTYVPLDPNYAQGRIEYMIEDTDPFLILYGSGLDALLESLGKSSKSRFIALSASSPATAFQTHHEPGQPDDIFYVVYTSGSTGKPKGIMASHENTRAMLSGRNQALAIAKDDVFLSHSSLSFDISITQTWGSFVSGATVALATNDTKQDIEELATFIRQAGVTMIFMTPTQFAMMIENCPEELHGSQSLRAVSMIGEHLHPRLVTAIYDLKLPLLTVYNEYGPSETTSQNTLYKVPYPSSSQRTIDVGRPLPNNSVYIVNSKLKPVPASVTGELCLGGPQVSLGYLQDYNTVFLNNPFVSGVFKSRGWDRLYRTGDLARFRRNGLIDLVGRISGDQQIKLRGNRIDLEEIESEIRRVSSINDSLPFKQGVVVIARALDQATSDSLTDDRQLVAFIVTRNELNKAEQQAMVNKLHKELSKTLNGYMLPAYYQMMTSLPSTLSGKTNRVELSKMTLDPVFHLETTKIQKPKEREVDVTPDQGPLEIIREIFKEVLKLPDNQVIQGTDSFFNLGGQSVLALRLQKALKKGLGVPVKLVDIFRSPTPEGLATVLVPKSGAVLSTAAVAPTPTELDWERETHLPNEARYWPGNVVKLKDNPTFLNITNASSTTTNDAVAKGTLLIGADGFVGYYMLKYLLVLHPDTRVYLLGLEERFNLGDLFAAFMEHKLFDKDLNQTDLLTRTEILQGTMGEDNFGLSNEDFDRLGGNVQSIYHTGGFVSLLATYTDLRARNVKSIFTMIELASRGGSNAPTSLHYISTWSVLHLQTWPTTTRTKDSVWLDEQNAASFQPARTNDLGYFKTRWVAEMLMEEASRRGHPTTIYRCPAHTAPIGSASATPRDNFTINMYLSMAQKGLVLRTPPHADKLESDIGMVPIDYLADTIIRLSTTSASRTAIGEALRLHIVNPHSVPYSQAPPLVAQVRDDAILGRLLDVDD
jgi:amino acid adenylation domain-containing protein